MIKKSLSLIFSCCKQFYYLKLDPRNSNLCLDLKYLDGKRVKKLIKHTTDMNCLSIFFTLTYEMQKRVPDDSFFFISHPITLQILYYLNLDPRSLNLCLDFKQHDGKEVKKLIKHTNRHERLEGSTIEKRILENLENLHFWPYQYENARLCRPWPKKSKSVLRFEKA